MRRPVPVVSFPEHPASEPETSLAQRCPQLLPFRATSACAGGGGYALLSWTVVTWGWVGFGGGGGPGVGVGCAQREARAAAEARVEELTSRSADLLVKTTEQAATIDKLTAKVPLYQMSASSNARGGVRIEQSSECKRGKCRVAVSE